jgi:hypothetical protein
MLALPVGVSGCIVEVEAIDPVGTDASVEGSWTLVGAAPTVESCAANGITHVRVRVYDGAEYADPASLVFPCEDGAFDTRPSAVLADGIWTVQLLAVNADAATGEAVIDSGPMMTFDTVVEGGHIVIPTADFMGDAPAGTRIEGSWTIDGAAPTTDGCAALGIDEVLLDIVSGPGGARTLKYACADGGFSEEVEPGSYDIRVVASSNATGEIAATELTETFMLVAGETYAVNGGTPIDYVGAFDPLGSDAAFEASWTIGGQDVVPPTSVPAGEPWACEAVGGTEVDFIFFPADDTARETEGVVVHTGAPCGEGKYDSVSPVLAAGSYLVTAELYDDGDNLISGVDLLEPVTVGAGTPLSLDVDFRLDSSTIHALLRYDDPVGGDARTCTETTPLVGEITWSLSLGGTAVADSGGGIACVDFVNVMGGSGGEPLEAGTYDLYFEGAVDGDSSDKRWMGGLCELTIDAAGGLGLARCEATYSTPG